ncbi:hypothetical protein BURKHO8Y_120129 [Burkholderia sp. 8Y]|nr:hypothetical protein BURKHO8Y_120129 [Burkholderia sp. 8Y]
MLRQARDHATSPAVSGTDCPNSDTPLIFSHKERANFQSGAAVILLAGRCVWRVDALTA